VVSETGHYLLARCPLDFGQGNILVIPKVRLPAAVLCLLQAVCQPAADETTMMQTIGTAEAADSYGEVIAPARPVESRELPSACKR
jgi:hypothetical protein